MAEASASCRATGIVAGYTLDAVNSAVDNSISSWNGGFLHESQKRFGSLDNGVLLVQGL
jgi:hypothetical protein